MIKEWEEDEKGDRFPKYTAEQAQRIARACWGIHHLLPHPQDMDGFLAQWRSSVITFNRALQALPIQEPEKPLPKLDWDVRVQKVGDAAYETMFRVGVQHFRIAYCDDNETPDCPPEAQQHCENMKSMFLTAMKALGLE
jgi:hypothetical protein